MKWNIFSVMAVIFLLAGCTHNGIRFGKVDLEPIPRTFNICVIADTLLSDEETKVLLDEQKEYFSEFGININYTVEKWNRAAFTTEEILYFVRDRTDIGESYDKILFLVSRDYRDWLMSFLWYDFGVCDGTIAVAVAQYASIEQFLIGHTPSYIVRHEMEHLFGCGHDILFTNCEKILRGYNPNEN